MSGVGFEELNCQVVESIIFWKSLEYMVDYRGHLVKVIEMQLRELKLILVALPAASYLNMPLFILMQKYLAPFDNN